jgi:hypothetical protein
MSPGYLVKSPYIELALTVIVVELAIIIGLLVGVLVR